MAKKKVQGQSQDSGDSFLDSIQTDIEELEVKLEKADDSTPDKEEEPDAVIDDPVGEADDKTESDIEPDAEEIPTEPKARNDYYAKQRAKEKENAKEVQSLKDQLAQITAYLNGQQSVQQRQEQPKIDADPEPDKILYKEDWLEWRQRQLDARQEYLEKTVVSQASNNQISQARIELIGIEDDFAKEKTDYKDAKNYLRQTEESTLKAIYPNVTSAQVKSYLDSEEIRLAAQAYQAGRNPAEVFYTLAQGRGYTGKKAEASNNVVVKKDSNFDALARNKRKSANIIDSSPSGKGGTPSAEAVVSAAFGGGFDSLLNISEHDWVKMEREARES